jgi:hypothetical protein
MSQTIIVEMIDGIEIVKGISKLTIDPAATKPVIAVEITKTPEYKACKKKQDEMNELFIQAKKKKGESSAQRANKLLSEKLYQEYVQIYTDATAMMQEVRELLPAVNEAQKRLFQTHAVYFGPSKRERVKTDEEIQDIQNKVKGLTPNQLINSDGTIVDNYVGQSFLHKVGGKWIKTDINKVGESKPSKSKLFDELTEPEKIEASRDMETKRISLLSESEKEKEKQGLLDKVLIDAATMRSGLEIKADKKALEKSRKWYNDTVADIEKLYA